MVIFMLRKGNQMNKVDWDEMEQMDKDEIVWDHFPDIAPDSDDWVLSRDGGESGFDFFETEEEANSGLLTYEGTEMFEGATVVHWRHCRNFTTDRNACALVLDEIDKRGDKVRMEFSEGLRKRMLGHESLSWGRISPEVDILRVSPDEICFCAVMVVENEKT